MTASFVSGGGRGKCNLWGEKSVDVGANRNRTEHEDGVCMTDRVMKRVSPFPTPFYEVCHGAVLSYGVAQEPPCLRISYP